MLFPKLLPRIKTSNLFPRHKIEYNKKAIYDSYLQRVAMKLCFYVIFIPFYIRILVIWMITKKISSLLPDLKQITWKHDWTITRDLRFASCTF